MRSVGLVVGFIAIFAGRHLGTPGPTSTNQQIASGKQLVIAGDVHGDVSALQPSSGAVLWTYQASGGSPINSVVTQNGIVFANTEFSVFALQETTGRLLWKVTTADQGPPGVWGVPGASYISGVSNPLFVTGNTVAFITLVGGSNPLQGLVALRASDGALLWKNVQPSPLIAPYGPYYRIVGSGDGVLFTTKDGVQFPLYAMNASNGKIVWVSDMGTNLSVNSILQLDFSILNSNVLVSGNTAYVLISEESSAQAWESVLQALDVKNGSLIWQHTTEVRHLSPVDIAMNGQSLAMTDVAGNQSECLLSLSGGAQKWCQAPWPTIISYSIPLDSRMFVSVNSGPRDTIR